MNSKKTTSYRLYQNGALTLAVIGLVLIVGAFIAAQLFDSKISLLRLVTDSLSNIGELFLIAGVLQWMFDHRMREEMIREIVSQVSGSTHIHDLGIVDCYKDSRKLGHQPEQIEEWKKSEKLIIGAHYTDDFFSNPTNLSMFEERCKTGRATMVLISDPNGFGVEYLHKIDKELPNVEEKVNRIIRLLTSLPHNCTTHMEIRLHSYVLRYLFLATEKSIWIVPMLNSKGHASVPAIQICHDSPLYTIFYEDIQRLIQQAVPPISTT